MLPTPLMEWKAKLQLEVSETGFNVSPHPNSWTPWNLFMEPGLSTSGLHQDFYKSQWFNQWNKICGEYDVQSSSLRNFFHCPLSYTVTLLSLLRADFHFSNPLLNMLDAWWSRWTALLHLCCRYKTTPSPQSETSRTPHQGNYIISKYVSSCLTSTRTIRRYESFETNCIHSTHMSIFSSARVAKTFYSLPFCVWPRMNVYHVPNTCRYITQGLHPLPLTYRQIFTLCTQSANHTNC